MRSFSCVSACYNRSLSLKLSPCKINVFCSYSTFLNAYFRENLAIILVKLFSLSLSLSLSLSRSLSKPNVLSLLYVQRSVHLLNQPEWVHHKSELKAPHKELQILLQSVTVGCCKRPTTEEAMGSRTPANRRVDFLETWRAVNDRHLQDQPITLWMSLVGSFPVSWSKDATAICQ